MVAVGMPGKRGGLRLGAGSWRVQQAESIGT